MSNKKDKRKNKNVSVDTNVQASVSANETSVRDVISAALNIAALLFCTVGPFAILIGAVVVLGTIR